jgi:hypothetical protein
MTSHREKDDDYDNVIAQLGPKVRLIECAENWQWIVQVKSGQRWRAEKFLTSRDGVIRRVGPGLGNVDVRAHGRDGCPGWEVLQQLPDRFQTGWKLKLSRGPAPETDISATGVAKNA